MNLPNKLTIARVICVPIFVVLYYLDLNLWACIVFVVASITDMLDGRIARSRNLVTNFGKIMDPLADKVLVYAAFCLFIEKGVMPGWMLIIILAREFAVSGMRTVAASQGTVVAAGMTGKIKTVLQMFAVIFLLLAPYAKTLDIIGKVLLWASLVMTIVSGAEYIIKNKNVFSM
ncbi:MAG: CDP-diacylglycerol--glycerol-3-phosphate 3-phosphatidyltransferase [Firmicutes bacterium]|nr:CDP-diacylglycerol--glycerol-3-phosphate 3-phosphatidyltransferase [Bacillota bacterium]